jgi:Zn-dependent protease
MEQDILAMLPLWYVAFLFSLTCHEAAHALAAKWGGDPTAYQAGQVTLNPVPHIRREPWGTVVMPLVTYLMNGGGMLGWGSAPYDPFWEQRYPKRAAWMALAGPAANLLLFLLATIGLRVGLATGTFRPVHPTEISFIHLVSTPLNAPLTEGFALFLGILFYLNLLLALFNLLPVSPLDGNTAIGLILPAAINDKFREFTRQPMLRMFGILIAWFAFSPLFEPLFVTALNLIYPGITHRSAV